MIAVCMTLTALCCVYKDALYFSDFIDHIHVNEKWFYINKINKNYYLAADEEEPHPTTPNKNHMMKVMFVVTVAHPRYDGHGQMVFDGKIGL